jgi:hypothetical protein
MWKELDFNGNGVLPPPSSLPSLHPLDDRLLTLLADTGLSLFSLPQAWCLWPKLTSGLCTRHADPIRR